MKTALLKIIRQVKSSRGLKINKQLSVFFVCFFIAAIFWFLISLNKSYNSVISFPIVYKDLPKDKVVVNKLPSSVSLEINARGFDLLGYHLRLLTVPIVIKVQANVPNELDEKDSYLVTKPLIASISKQLNSEGRVVSIEPDTVFFKFNKRLTKKVPVKANIRLYFEKQYNIAGKIKISPESVWITGPEHSIDSIEFLFTERLILKNIKAAYSQTVKVNIKGLRDNIRVITKNVTVQIPVEKFTEETVEIPIEVKNNTVDYRIKTIPDKVKITYLVSLSNYDKVSANSFTAIANFASLEAVKNSKIKVELLKKPDFIKILKITPSKVDYLKIK